MKHLPDTQSRDADCEIHGRYTSYSHPGGKGWTGCYDCGQAARAEKAAQQQREERVASVQAKLMNSGIPEMYKRAKLEGEVAEWTAKAISGESAGPLIIVGTPGTGKTHLSCAALRHWIIRTELGGYYLPAADYAVQIRSTWDRRSNVNEHDVLNQYGKAPFVVLDDLGAGRAQDMEIVQGLIDLRYRSVLMRHTIVVSNIAGPNFDDRFGERAADRLRDKATIIEMIGESMRRPAA